MTQIDAIRIVLAQKKMSVLQLEKACGFSNGTIRSVKTGSLKQEKLEKVCEILGVTVQELTAIQYADKTKQDYEEINQEADALNKFLKLDNTDRKIVMDLMDGLLNKQRGI